MIESVVDVPSPYSTRPKRGPIEACGTLAPPSDYQMPYSTRPKRGPIEAVQSGIGWLRSPPYSTRPKRGPIEASTSGIGTGCTIGRIPRVLSVAPLKHDQGRLVGVINGSIPRVLSVAPLKPCLEYLAQRIAVLVFHAS